MNIVPFKERQGKRNIRPMVEKEPSYRIYARAIDRFAVTHKGIKKMSKDDFKKLLYLQIKYIEAVNREKSQRNDVAFYNKPPMERFKLLDAIVQMIGMLKEKKHLNYCGTIRTGL